MSLVNTLTRGLIYKDGEHPVANVGSWGKNKNSQYWVSNRLTNLIHVYIPLFPIWIFSLFTIWGKKVIGRSLGFGCCSNCDMPWKYVKHQSIKYSENSGMFPLCVKCFNALSPEKIDAHIEALVLSWVEDNNRYGHKWDMAQSPEEVIAAAKQGVRVMKL